jgi:HPt (histidine-containing phosphotransfer) domain-containing protein
MTDDFLARFMPKFTAIARQRIARSVELANQRSAEHVPAIMRELHAIAGEAGLLGLGAIVVLARSGEEHAKRLKTSRTSEDADVLLATLTELESAIERIVAQPEANT